MIGPLTHSFVQGLGASRVEIVSNDRRIQMESNDLDDFVVYSVSSSQFAQVFKGDCLLTLPMLLFCVAHPAAIGFGGLC